MSTRSPSSGAHKRAKRPLSSLFAYRQRPVPSHTNTFALTRSRLTNKNMSPLVGSRSSSCLTTPAKPSNPFLMSVGPVNAYTRNDRVDPSTYSSLRRRTADSASRPSTRKPRGVTRLKPVDRGPRPTTRTSRSRPPSPAPARFAASHRDIEDSLSPRSAATSASGTPPSRRQATSSKTSNRRPCGHRHRVRPPRERSIA